MCHKDLDSELRDTRGLGCTRVLVSWGRAGVCLHVEIVCALTSEFLLSWKTLPLPPAALVQRSHFYFSPNSVSGLCQGLGSGLSVQARAPAVWSALEAGLQQ